MRVAGELAMTIETAQIEPKQDLADTVALSLWIALQLLKAHPSHELAHKHPLARE